MKLIGTDGSIAASYTYDAWGNILSSNGTMANINPLRYRGYYYDGETGFYYLRSRYYDPANRRFISADSLASTGQGFVGTNMFAYCGNNPVRKEDASGKDSATIDLTLGEQEEKIELDCFVVRVSVTVKYTDGYNNGKNGVNISTDLQGVSVGASVGKLTVSVYGGKFRPKFGIAIDGEYMGLSLDYYFSGGFGGTITYKKGKFTYEIEVEFRDIDSGNFLEATDTWVTRIFSYVIPPVVIWGKGELPSAKHTGGGYGINVLLAR